MASKPKCRISTSSFLIGFVLMLFAAFCLACIFQKIGAASLRRTPPQLENALPHGATIDRLHRLSAWPSKIGVKCPQQDKKSVVILILGQSNAGNHGGDRRVPKHHGRIVNFFEGKCFDAGSPLLGSTGQGGEPWTELADQLIADGSATLVVLAPLAISGSTISRWIPNGDLYATFQNTISLLRFSYTPTHVFWIQGESDFARKTDEFVYGAGLRELSKSLKRALISAPLYIALATKCAEQPKWTPDNDIARAQRAFVAAEENVFAGPDMDNILTPEDRYDGCHLTRQGLAKVANEWASLLRNVELSVSAL